MTSAIRLEISLQLAGHFLTVISFSNDGSFVIANDPLKGEVHIPVETFNQAWQANGTPESVSPFEDTFPPGTKAEDRRCWLCDGWTVYRQCKIICQQCGFMRDCSDP